MKKYITGGAAALFIYLGMSASVQAAPITGDPLAPGSWANSTNALNYAGQAPGREGQIAPHVLFNSSGTGFVSLDFFNYAVAGIAFFEYRLDGVSAGTTGHPVIAGDTIHPGVFVANQAEVLNQVFNVSNFVDVRLALGGERDWDFDWVRFEVASATVPAPALLTLFAIGLFGMGITARRRRR